MTSFIQNFYHRLSQRNLIVILFIAIFAIIGVYLIIGSHAATPYASIEAENGTLANGAVKVTDSNASNGNAVKFGSLPSGTSGSYTISGSSILNSSGQTVTLHGVSLSSTEWSCNGDGNFPASAFATMHNEWNANAVRIPLFQDMWLSTAKDYCSSYAANIAGWVKAAQANNMVVILDLHWSDKGNLDYTPQSSNQQCMADQNSNTFWQQVASTYKTNPGVWFELYNEPELSNWSAWENGDSSGSVCGFPIVGMQTLYNTVRATGANNIVIAGGISHASHLDGVPLLNGTNIAYAIHPYANDIDGGNAGSWSNSDWDNRFGYLVQQNKAPVIATEFGDTECGNSSGAASYDTGILNYFRNNHISYTGWAWYVGGCGYPSLISDWSGDCVKSMGCTIQTDMKKY
jgi:endoglucanase